MAVEFFDAPEAQRIAEALIPKYHSHLQGIVVRCVLRDKAAKSGGKVVYGKARKVDGLTAYLAYPDEDNLVREFFILEFARDVWATLSDDSKRALVDHELCHCSIDIDDEGELHLAIRPHDIEEFNEIIERHGMWTPDLQEFRKSIAKSEMQMDGAPAPSFSGHGPAPDLTRTAFDQHRADAPVYAMDGSQIG